MFPLWLVLLLVGLPLTAADDDKPRRLLWNLAGPGADEPGAQHIGATLGAAVFGGMGGAWPRIADDGFVINGGTPQYGDFAVHEIGLRQTIASRVPVGFAGYAVFDFRAYTSILSLNNRTTGAVFQARYLNYTLAQAKARGHNRSWAEEQFEKITLEWFVQTLVVARSIRPTAQWGYYGYPIAWDEPCDRNYSGYSEPQCGYLSSLSGLYESYVKRQKPIYGASTALFPSVALHKHLLHGQLFWYVHGVISLAYGVSDGWQVVPVVQLSYTGGGFLAPGVVYDALNLPLNYSSGYPDLIVQGYFDALTPWFVNYVLQVVGPAWAAVAGRG